MEQYQKKEVVAYEKNFEKSFIPKKMVFHKILSLIHSFFKNNKKLDSNNSVLPLTSIQLKADQFIAISNYELLEKMVKNGYELLPNQKINVQNYIGNLLLEHTHISSIHVNHDIIEKWLTLGVDLKENTKEEYFKELISKIKIKRYELNFSRKRQDFHNIYPLSFFYGNEGNMKKNLSIEEIVEFPLLTHQLKQYVQSHPLVYNVFVSAINNLINKKDNHYDNCDNLLEEMLLDDRKIYLLQQLNFEKLLQILTDFNQKTEQDNYKQIKKILQTMLNTDFNDNVKEILTDVKKQYGDKYIEKEVIHNMQKETQHITILNLPTKAKNILKDIYELNKKIQHSTIKIDETQLHDIKSLFEKRIPEILKKYLTIDEQYKIILKNSDGKNAEELMIDSLGNIQSYFDKVWQNINLQAVSSLSVSHRYTKNFKK